MIANSKRVALFMSKNSRFFATKEIAGAKFPEFFDQATAVDINSRNKTRFLAMKILNASQN